MSIYAYIAHINNGHSLILRPQKPISIRVSSNPWWLGSGSSLGQVEQLSCICATTCGAKARRGSRKCSSPGWNGWSGRPPMQQCSTRLRAASHCLSRCWVTWSFCWSIVLPTSTRDYCNSPPRFLPVRIPFRHAIIICRPKPQRHSIDTAVLHSTTSAFSPLSSYWFFSFDPLHFPFLRIRQS